MPLGGTGPARSPSAVVDSHERNVDESEGPVHLTTRGQPEEWTEPGAHLVVPGIHRIPLPIPDEGLRAVNVYVVEGDDGPSMVDGGWVGPAGQRALIDGLRQLSHTPADIRQIFVTHAHYDHYSLALSLREQFGCRVLLGSEERHTVVAGLYPETSVVQGPLLHRCGAPELAGPFVDLLRQQELPADVLRWAEPDDWLVHGQRFEVGRHTLEVIGTPGHTRGHVVLHAVESGLLFSGDHILPHITPSIGFERVPEPLPVRSFLRSLQLIRGLPDAAVLPAHGPITASAHARADELLAHHRDRLADSLAGVDSDADTAYAVAVKLPWTRRNRSLDELEPVHKGLAVIEVGAHLDLLADRGRLTFSDDSRGIRRYARTR
jgi:glyoxylase-like metal-dependent hydrolase (beta-lactamase superfamily II)